MQRIGSLFLLLLFSLESAAQNPPVPCAQDKEKSEARSRELATLVKADQEDRNDWTNKSNEAMIEVMKRDEKRRRRVGEIFGEGCFSKAEDYAAAALVFQHGDAPDHFFQTFLWAKRAVALGDSKQKSLMALGLDRYLVSIGQKQLFGSQASRPASSTCWCLQPIERSFPEKRRQEYVGKTVADYFQWLKELNQGKACPNTECDTKLQPSPQQTVPGFW